MWWPIIFAIAALCAFGSALNAPFEFDDYPAIRANTTIQDLSSAAVLHPPPETSVAGRPVVNLSLALNYAVNDAAFDDPLTPAGFRFVNILLQLAAALLLFALLRRTFAHAHLDPSHVTSLAGMATLLWLVHPLQTEAVDYVVQRTELLVSIFYLAALVAADRAADAADGRRRGAWYAAALSACLLGAASKEVMATAPVMLVLYDRTFRSSSWRDVFGTRAKRFFYAGACATIAAVIALVSLGARGRSVGFALGVPWYVYLHSQGYAIARYLRLLVWPSGLTFDYGEAPFHGGMVLLAGVFVSLLLAASVVAWWVPRTRRWGFAGLWFFLLLAPSSSVVPIRTEIAAERRVHLAIASLIAAAVVACYLLARRRPVPAVVRVVTAVAVPCVLVAASVARGLAYGSQESLYRDVVAKVPANPRAHVGVGLALLQDGSDSADAAIREFKLAIAYDSSSFVAWQALGSVAVFRGDWPQARDAFRRALRIAPENRDAAAGMARAYLGLEEPDSAAPYVHRVGDADPEAERMLAEQLAGQMAARQHLR